MQFVLIDWSALKVPIHRWSVSWVLGDVQCRLSGCKPLSTQAPLLENKKGPGGKISLADGPGCKSKLRWGLASPDWAEKIFKVFYFTLLRYVKRNCVVLLPWQSINLFTSGPLLPLMKEPGQKTTGGSLHWPSRRKRLLIDQCKASLSCT